MSSQHRNSKSIEVLIPELRLSHLNKGQRQTHRRLLHGVHLRGEGGRQEGADMRKKRKNMQSKDVAEYHSS